MELVLSPGQILSTGRNRRGEQGQPGVREHASRDGPIIGIIGIGIGISVFFRKSVSVSV